MKIINDNDDRYDKLDYLFNTYNWSNIRRTEKLRAVYYLVPKELNRVSDTWISNKYLGRYLLNVCDLTIQEFFDLLILHINDTDDRPKCSYEGCNNYLKFTSMSQGYRSGGTWHQDPKGYCCNEHQRLAHEDANKSSLNSPDSYIKRCRTFFINKGNSDDNCTLYVTSLISGDIKYGITSHDLKSRKHNANRAGIGYDKIFPITTGTREYVANLEADIKSKFNSREYLDRSELPELKYVLESLGLTIPSEFIID